MALFPKYPLVEIEWVDSYTRGGWKTAEEYQTDVGYECKTIGYLVVNSKAWVQVVQTLAVDGKMTDSIAIPRACVKRMRRLH